MGKFRTRTKAAKGKRWIKGHSCVSNPDNTTHRELAKGRFFQENLGQKGRPTASLLTSDALQKHDILLNSETTMNMEETQSESGDTFKTFASDWTNCTNITFNRLLKGFRSDSAHHKEMLAVLAAVTEVIKSQGGSETTNEYFGALMTALEISASEENTSAILSLLNVTVRNVSHNILRLKCDELLTVFSSLLDKYSESENTAILIGAIHCLSAVLKAQDIAMWHKPGVKNTFNILLAFTTHSKPKVRKSAQGSVAYILKDKALLESKTLHPAAGPTGDYCVSQLEGPTGNVASSGITTILHTLGFLKGVMFTFPRAQLKACCESILKVMTLGEPRVMLCGLQAIHGLLLLKPPTTTLTPDLTAKLISALFDFKPEDNDLEPMLMWLTVMQEGYSCLIERDVELCLSNIHRFARQVSQLLERDRVELLSGAGLALKTVVLECFNYTGQDKKVLRVLENTISQLLKVLDSCLRSQCYAAWKYVIHILGALYQVAGAKFPLLLSGSLKRLAMLREQDQLELGAHVDKALGLAVRSMGPAGLLQVLPLKINFQGEQLDFPNSWLLPVLRENVERAELSYFAQNICPLATQCKKKCDELAKENHCIGAHSFELVYVQLWALLPGFCNDPTDFDTGVKGVAKTMGQALNNKDLCLDVMAGLRKLVACSLARQDSAGAAQMANYAKNFLPILFNMYTDTPDNTFQDGQRLAALETIKTYIQITPADFRFNLFDRAFDKLTGLAGDDNGSSDKKTRRDKKEKDTKVRDSMLQLLMVLLPYQDTERIIKMYQLCSSLLLSQDHREQKRGYRAIEELCKAENQQCREFVLQNLQGMLDILTTALSKTKPPSRASRLRCLLLLVGRLQPQHEPLLKNMVPEAVLCCKDINEKCRAAAFALLIEVGKTLQRWTEKPASEVVKDYLVLILPGLEGSVSLISATVLALASLLYEYGDLMPRDTIDLLVHNMSTLLVCDTREVVGACLSFFKAMFSVYDVETCGPHVETLVRCLSEMKEDCKRHFRIKCRELMVRLVRRYGIMLVSSVVPEEDEIMQKRLKNIRKEQERKARARDASRQSHGDSDEDMDVDFEAKTTSKSIEEILAECSDDEDHEDHSQENVSRVKPKAKAWIRESDDTFVDFTEPTVAQQISATGPTAKGNKAVQSHKDKNRGFKTASDGRLIIEDSSDSEEDNTAKKRTKKTAVDSDEEEDEAMEDSSAPGRFVLAPGSKRRRASSPSSAGTASEPPSKYRAGGSGIHRPLPVRGKAGRGKQERAPRDVSGAEYRAAKASGDVKKKGRPDPYAYIPLNGKLLNRRKRAKNAGLMKNLVTSAIKGVKRGMKARASSIRKRV